MAGLFAISINPTVYKGNFPEDLFLGTFYLQHLGEDYCGMSALDGSRINIRTHKGLLKGNFNGRLNDMRGTEAIGYCGSAREPFRIDSKMGRMSLCFSGNIVNRFGLKSTLENQGRIFERGDDIEVIAQLIAKGMTIVEGIKIMTQEIRGAYSLLILTEKGIYAACCPTGHWPLVIGEKEGVVAISSESGGFDNLGFKLVRDLEPGEIVFIKNGRWETREKLPVEKVQICSFLWVYTTFPNAVIRGIPASLVRKRLGAALARRDIERGFIPDIVAPIPDSGRFHAIGYFQEFCRQVNEGNITILPLYDEVLLKFPYAGRSYTPQNRAEREKAAHIKLLKSAESYTGKKVVVCEDSIVRGTQTQTNLVPKLRSLGIEEVHFRVSNPELLSHCPWGKTTKKGETLASRMPLKKDRIKFLGIESLEYNTVDDLVQVIGLPAEKICADCALLRD